jgi:hypothetical protein
MTGHGRNLLSVLKAELTFIEKRGYWYPIRNAWRPQFVFKDSPTCLNFDGAQRPRPCSECALIRVVPSEFRKKKFPCRYIALNDRGETVDSFYRSGTPEELEAAVTQGLRSMIRDLELERTHVAGNPGKGKQSNKEA